MSEVVLNFQLKYGILFIMNYLSQIFNVARILLNQINDLPKMCWCRIRCHITCYSNGFSPTNVNSPKLPCWTERCNWNTIEKIIIKRPKLMMTIKDKWNIWKLVIHLTLSWTSSLDPLPIEFVASQTYFPAESLSTFCITKLYSLIMMFRWVAGDSSSPYF